MSRTEHKNEWVNRLESVRTLFQCIKETPDQVGTIFENLDSKTISAIAERIDEPTDENTIKELKILRETFAKVPNASDENVAMCEFLLLICENKAKLMELSRQTA